MKILHIDDNPDDRALVRRELRKVFPQVRTLEVVDAAAFQSALQGGGIDLVITDYQIGWSDGLTVLREARRRLPECPVVMFTGTGSEEIAVEAMKLGLSDYVLKSPRHYGRLATACQVAVQMTRQQRELRASELRFTRLFETVPIGLYRASTDGRLLDVNGALMQMLGYPSRPLLLARSLETLHVRPEDFARWRSVVEKGEILDHCETEWFRTDGHALWIEHYGRLVRSHVPHEPAVVEGVVADVSGRKEAENERERLLSELQHAFSQLKTLSGLVPICASCKRIRDEAGHWTEVETFIHRHSDADFTHSFCPECVRTLYPEAVRPSPASGGESTSRG